MSKFSIVLNQVNIAYTSTEYLNEHKYNCYRMIKKRFRIRCSKVDAELGLYFLHN